MFARLDGAMLVLVAMLSNPSKECITDSVFYLTVNQLVSHQDMTATVQWTSADLLIFYVNRKTGKVQQL